MHALVRRSRPLLLAAVLATSSISAGCIVRGGAGLLFLAADAALITAVVVSNTRPPPPRVVFVPEERPGYAWQPGYWTLHEGQWDWVDGGWVQLQPGFGWSPAHWQARPDGESWELVPGHWVPLNGPQAYPPQPPPPLRPLRRGPPRRPRGRREGRSTCRPPERAGWGVTPPGHGRRGGR